MYYITGKMYFEENPDKEYVFGYKNEDEKVVNQLWQGLTSGFNPLVNEQTVFVTEENRFALNTIFGARIPALIKDVELGKSIDDYRYELKDWEIRILSSVLTDCGNFIDTMLMMIELHSNELYQAVYPAQIVGMSASEYQWLVSIFRMHQDFLEQRFVEHILFVAKDCYADITENSLRDIISYYYSLDYDREALVISIGDVLEFLDKYRIEYVV